MAKKKLNDPIVEKTVVSIDSQPLISKPPSAINEEESEDDGAIGDVPASISYLEPLLHPLRDLTENWNVDLCRSLQAYLHDIGDTTNIPVSLLPLSPRREMGVLPINSPFNFAQAALVIQGSSLIYSKKVEYFYTLVRRFLDRHTRLYAQSARGECTSNELNECEPDETNADPDDTHARKAYEACASDERELLKRSINPGSGQNITCLDETFTLGDVSTSKFCLACTNTTVADQGSETILYQSVAGVNNSNGHEEFRDIEGLDILQDTLPDSGVPPVDPLFLLPNSDPENEVDEERGDKGPANRKKKKARAKHKKSSGRDLLRAVQGRTSKLIDATGNIIGERFDFFINRTMLNATGWLLLEQNLSTMVPNGLDDASAQLMTQTGPDHFPTEPNDPLAPDPWEHLTFDRLKVTDMAATTFDHLSEDEGIELADPELNPTSDTDEIPTNLTKREAVDRSALDSSAKANKSSASGPKQTYDPNDMWALMDPYEILDVEPHAVGSKVARAPGQASQPNEGTGQFDYRKVTKKAALREAYLRSRYQPHPASSLHFHRTAFETLRQLMAFVSDPVIEGPNPGAYLNAQLKRLNNPEFTKFVVDIAALNPAPSHGVPHLAHTKKEVIPARDDNGPGLEETIARDLPDNYSDGHGSPCGSPTILVRDNLSFDPLVHPPSPAGGDGDVNDDYNAFAEAVGSAPGQISGNLNFFALDDDELEAGNATLVARQTMGTRCKNYLEQAQATARSTEAGTAAAYEEWENFIKTQVLAQGPTDFVGPFSTGRSSQTQGHRKRQRLHDKLRYDIISDQESIFACLEGEGDATGVATSFADVVTFSLRALKPAEVGDGPSSALGPEKGWLGLPKLIPRLFFACLLLANSGNVDIIHENGGADGFDIKLKSLVRKYEKLKEQLDL